MTKGDLRGESKVAFSIEATGPDTAVECCQVEFKEMYQQRTIYSQGDLLFERVDDMAPMPDKRSRLVDGVAVLAEGEQTGHRHAVLSGAVMFRDDALARDIPDGLYVAHLRVGQAGTRVVHEEHAPLKLETGTYRVRRQRELQPEDVALVAD